jgi:hypothetical protein
MMPSPIHPPSLPWYTLRLLMLVARKACLWGQSMFIGDQQKETEGVHCCYTLQITKGTPNPDFTIVSIVIYYLYIYWFCWRGTAIIEEGEKNFKKRRLRWKRRLC